MILKIKYKIRHLKFNYNKNAGCLCLWKAHAKLASIYRVGQFSSSNDVTYNEMALLCQRWVRSSSYPHTNP